MSDRAAWVRENLPLCASAAAAYAAAFPDKHTRASKFWPSVGRVDNVYGDRNLVCSCVGMEAYADTRANA